MKCSFVFRVLCVSTILLSFNCFAGSQYPDVTIEPFPIMTWIPPALTAQQLGWYKQAGFNVMFIYPEEETYKKMKEHWDDNWMVFKEWNRKGYDYKTMCDFHADDPKRIGFMLGDEPNVSQIDGYVEQYNYLRSKHPEDICLVNMFPSNVYVNEVRLGGTFRKYVKTYFEKLQPRYVALDHYACYRFNVNSPSFYHDLEIIRETSQENNCKQFGFVQVYSSRADRDVSESDLAWQVNSFLAYNCKGLWYFYFRHPVSGINDIVGAEVLKRTKHEMAVNYAKGHQEEEYYSPIYKFGSGVLTADDQKGERFDDVVQTNKETLVWGKTLIGLKNLRIRHFRGFNEAFVPVGANEFARWEWHGSVDQYIASIEATDKHNSMGYILSYFEDKDKRPYIMIVNKRHGEFMSRKGGLLNTVVAFTKDVKKVYSISNKTGKEEEIKLNKHNAFEKEIEGGCAILLRLSID
jgi:hypothetical protein